MKRIFVFCLCVLILAGANAQTEVKSKMEKVTIYLNSALVEKSIKVNLHRGENKFIITSNASAIRGENIHFSSSNDWFISSQNIEKRTTPEKEAAKKILPQGVFQQYLSLKNKYDGLAEEIADNKSFTETLIAQKAALSNMKATTNTSAIDTVAVIKSQFAFQRDEMKNINKLLAEANTKSGNLTYQLNNTKREIENLVKPYAGGKNILCNDNNILITVYSNVEKQNEIIKYSYSVHNVSSKYSYDVMLDEETHKAVFSLKSSVSQNTNENWKDCEIIFSTSDGNYAGQDAELMPYYLDYNYNNTYKSPSKARLQKSAMANGYIADERAYDNETLLEAVVVEYTPSSVQNLSLNKEYTLSTSQSIATNEGVLTIPLYSEETKALFTRFSTPKNEEKVFYTALLPDWEDLGLLESECDVYLNNKFISKSYINTRGMGDTMRFSVGEDRNVKVTRKLRKNSPSEKGFLSKEVEEQATVTLTIKNTKNENIKLSLKDQIPISANSEIKISNIETGEGELNANTGIIRWNINLEPREEKQIVFSYTVKYPKGQRVTLN